MENHNKVKIKDIRLQYAHYMPQQLEPGVLYVSKSFDTAAHLCACGCGSKIRTPLSPSEWALEENKNGPTLYPSVGNWQITCQSHYWIRDGKIIWASAWSPEQIAAGRLEEEHRRQSYFGKQNNPLKGISKKFYQWFKDLFKP